MLKTLSCNDVIWSPTTEPNQGWWNWCLFGNGTLFYPYTCKQTITVTSYERHGLSNHWQPKCLFRSLFGLTFKRTSKPALLALCDGEPRVGFSLQRASNMDNVISCHHHGHTRTYMLCVCILNCLKEWKLTWISQWKTIKLTVTWSILSTHA